MASDNTDKKQKPQLFKKGQSGNPNGRPKGSKNKLSEDFVNALAADFERYGLWPIARVRRKDPAAYLRTIASLVPKEFSGNVKHDHEHKHTHESISDTHEWINGIIGGIKEGEVKKPSTH